MTNYQKIWRLLNRDQRRFAKILFGLMLIGMVLETLGVGLVIPALGLVTNKDLAESYPALSPLLAALGSPSPERLVIVGMFSVAAFYGFKAVFLLLLAWLQARFAFGLQASLSQRLFARYLHQPWAFHLQRNSAQLIRNVTTEVSMLTGATRASLVVLTDGLVAVSVGILLMVVEPTGALLVVTTMGFAAWALHHFTRERLLRWGEDRQHHEGLRIQHLQQGLSGAKVVKMFGREAEFLTRYSLHNLGAARIGQHQATLQQVPRLWLELLAVVGLATLVLVMIRLGRPLDSVLPTLGLFAAAAFRLMPSVNRVMSAMQTIRFSLPVVNMLEKEMALPDAAAAPTRRRSLPFVAELAIDDVSFCYPNSDSPALLGVSLSIPRGISVGFIGESGAGKSTLVDIILGLLTPSRGRVTVDNVDIQQNLRGWMDQIGYVPQSIFLTDDTLRCNVAFGLADAEIDNGAVLRAVCAARLEEFIATLPQGLDTLVGERGVRLSGGQRQRIGIARALYRDPEVLVLDEATNSLDVATERRVMEAVTALQGSKTVLIVAHRLSTVEHCDKLYRLHMGSIVA